MSTDTTDPSDDVDFDRTYHGEEEEEDPDSAWWDVKLASLIIIVGAVLLLFPEPISSVFGIALILTGVVFAAVDEFGEFLADN